MQDDGEEEERGGGKKGSWLPQSSSYNFSQRTIGWRGPRAPCRLTFRFFANYCNTPSYPVPALPDLASCRPCDMLMFLCGQTQARKVSSILIPRFQNIAVSISCLSRRPLDLPQEEGPRSAPCTVTTGPNDENDLACYHYEVHSRCGDPHIMDNLSRNVSLLLALHSFPRCVFLPPLFFLRSAL